MAVLGGTLESLSNLIGLRHLNLYGCAAVSGDLSALSRMSQLAYLSLGRMPSVSGDLSSVSQLVHLRELYLFSTGVHGPISALSGGDFTVKGVWQSERAVNLTVTNSGGDWRLNLRFDASQRALVGTAESNPGEVRFNQMDGR